jgi:chondroitin AC lyase
MKAISMGMRWALLGWAGILASIQVTGQTDPDIDTIRNRLLGDILAQPVRPSSVHAWLGDQRPDGAWPGIDYVDTSRTGFQHRIHLERLLGLAIAFRKPGSPYRGDARVRQAAVRAVDHWIRNDYICQNWWWNEIGTPDLMIRALLVLDDALDPPLREAAFRIARRASLDSGFGARPGGDLIKIAGLLGAQGLYRRDAATVERVIRVMAGEIRTTEGRGLKPDMSFHHRTDKVISTLSYGLAYPQTFSYWATLLRGTRFRFPDSAMHLLVDFFLDGVCKSMAFSRIPDIAARNRDLSRQGDLLPFSDAIASRLLAVSDYRREELQRVAEVQRGTRTPDFIWNKYFPYSEYVTHQRPTWFASVRMHSARQEQNVEFPYNEEGLKMHHLPDGACYTQVTGREYLDIAPVWDWQKIPGTTVLQRDVHPHWNEIQRKGRSEFVGAVGDGRYGAVAMHLKSVHDPLEAKKAWFFFDDEYVCLGSGIRAASGLPIATTVEQCLQEGPVTIGQDGHSRRLKDGRHTIHDPQWIAHGRLMYRFPGKGNVQVQTGKATGTWRSINHQDWATDGIVQRDVVKIWFEEKEPGDGTYAYVVAPVTEGRPASAQRTASIHILRNDTAVQAVEQTGLGILQAVIHEAGAFTIGKRHIVVDKPCMVMWGPSATVHVSDPKRSSASITVTIDGRTRVVRMPSGPGAGTSAKMDWE